MTHVVVVGNGIAGVTAALRLREKRPDWRITMVSGESTHPWSRPALMYVFMGHMRYQDTKPWEDRTWAERRIELVRDWAVGLDLERRTLALRKGGELAWDKLLLATGSHPNRFGWPGQDLDGVQGLYGLRDLKLLYDNVRGCRHAVVVGGGLIGIELAEMLHSRGVGVSLLVREPRYWGNVLPAEEGALVERVIRRAGLDLRLSTSLREVLDDGRGRAGGVVCDESGERIDCQLVGLTAGVRPNLDLVRGSGLETGRGIVVDASLRTSAPDVLAAGDCAELCTPDRERPLLQQVWYTGRMQGEVAGDVLAGEERAYEPGIWFNSAKFLELEYQTYGRVNQDLSGERSLVWQDPRGDALLRLVFTERGLEGVNVLGLRLRHAVCERWIRDGADPEHVLAHLEEAWFDPELARRHEPAIRAALRGAQPQAAG